MKITRILASAVWLGLILTGKDLLGATINWGNAQNISGDTDVSTVDNLLYAYNFGSTGVSSTTINGITFQAFSITSDSLSATEGDVTISESPGFLVSGNSGSSSSAPFSSLSSSYQGLLSSYVFGYNNTGLTLTLTLGGLVAGEEYQFQWWTNDSVGGGAPNIEATAGNSVTLLPNVSQQAGGTGQFVIGTFFAGNTSQAVTFISTTNNGNGAYPLINGFQLSTVPEPPAYLLVALSTTVLCLCLRRDRPLPWFSEP
jgi:hypothetical protein